MAKRQIITKTDWIVTIMQVGVFVVGIILGGVFLLPDYWILWTGIVVTGVLLLVGWHLQMFAYICPDCNCHFNISFWQDFLSPNGLTKKYLKCPKCHKRLWMEITKRSYIII